MPCSQTPAGRTAPSPEDELDSRGVAVPGGFRLRLYATAGASFRAPRSLFLAASRRAVLSPPTRTTRTPCGD